MEIILGNEQLEALSLIKSFINGNELVFSLTGSAGTGKSLLESYIIKYLEEKEIDYALCAPTHKAALVMKTYTKRSAVTLHKLLALSPKLDILELDFRSLHFNRKFGQENIPYKGIVICDEASMINDDLFDYLIKKCEEFNSKIIFISDKAQLNPVKSLHHSKVYSVKNKYNLTQIYRQSTESALVPVLKELRTKPIKKFESSSGKEGSIIVTSDLKSFILEYIKQVRISIKDKNILYTKLLAFTNKRIAQYSYYIRKYLWNNDNEYNIGEILTAYENGDCDGSEYFNSMDYIVLDYNKSYRNLYNLTLDGYDLTLYNPYDSSKFTIFILSRDNDDTIFKALAETIESIRRNAIQSKGRLRNMYWQNYYKLIGQFTTPVNLVYNNRVIRKKSFDYGYAQSVHKSQGSSYNNVFIDLTNINKCSDDKLRQQLQYVAVSRTRENAYIYQNK